MTEYLVKQSVESDYLGPKARALGPIWRFAAAILKAVQATAAPICWKKPV